MSDLKIAIQRGEESLAHPEGTFQLLLGSKDKLIDFASFYEKHKNELAVLQEYYLREFNQTQVYSSQENLFFRKGLECSFEFLKRCLEEKTMAESSKLTPAKSE